MPRIWYLEDGSVHVTRFPPAIDADPDLRKAAVDQLLAAEPAVYGTAMFIDVPEDAVPKDRSKRHLWCEAKNGGITHRGSRNAKA